MARIGGFGVQGLHFGFPKTPSIPSSGARAKPPSSQTHFDVKMAPTPRPNFKVGGAIVNEACGNKRSVLNHYKPLCFIILKTKKRKTILNSDVTALLDTVAVGGASGMWGR